LTSTKQSGVPGAAQQEIDAAALVVPDLAPNHLVASELGDAPGADRLLDQAVGMHGVDADQTAVRLDQLEREGEDTPWVARRGDPHARARRIKPEHAARVGAMHGHLAAAIQDDVGEEPLVPAH
jgi:hypothetical protein